MKKCYPSKRGIVLGIIISTFLAQSYGDRYVTLVGTNDLVVLNSNETALVVSGGMGENYITYQKEGGASGQFAVTTIEGYAAGSWSIYVSIDKPLPLVGPATIFSGQGVVGMKIVATTYATPSAGSSALGIPSNSVVIPADADGPVEIIMESSADLISWTAAVPGTYGATASHRFFRVRAVQK